MNADWLRSCLASLTIMLPVAVGAQGFASLGTDAEGYATVEPGRVFDFPADHGPHPDYRIEWWYLTANLEDAEGTPLGIQWTLFRQALAPGPQREGWESQQFWMGHAGLTTPHAHYSAERFARGGIGQAGVELDPFAAWIDDWELDSTSTEGDPLSAMTVKAAGEDFSYSLQLMTDRPPALQGEAGYSVKSPEGQASYYYSQPYFRVAGEIEIEGVKRDVTGRAWMDREWSSQPLSSDQQGWDWFSLHLPGGEKLMVFGLRSGQGETYRAGTWFSSSGRGTALSTDEIALTALATTDIDGRQVPTSWRIEIPARRLAIETEPVNAQSWMATTVSYWEGPIRFSGSHEGVGYLEMTGYDEVR
jgi:predicted secreted hydrolase